MLPSTTKQLLIDYANTYENSDFIVGDPSWFMHQVQGDDNREAMAFVAQAFSYGSRKQFLPKIEQIMALANSDVYRWIKEGAYSDFFSADDHHCFYRLHTNADVFSFFHAYQQIIERFHNLKNYVHSTASTGSDAVSSLCSLFCTLGASALIPKNNHSACKRLCMFLRWMVRDSSSVDLGLWSDIIDKKSLIMPLDTHVLAMSVRLNLLNSKTASFHTATLLTDTMREVFPDDPLRGDFALFGYDVNNP